MAKHELWLKKGLRHPAFAVLGPIMLALLVLVFLRCFGGRYEEMPFLYTYF